MKIYLINRILLRNHYKYKQKKKINLKIRIKIKLKIMAFLNFPQNIIKI